VRPNNDHKSQVVTPLIPLFHIHFRNDVLLELRDAQLLLDYEGRTFHHFDYFCQLYQTEIICLNRMLETLFKNGLLPPKFLVRFEFLSLGM